MPPKPQSTKKPVSKPTVTTAVTKGGAGPIKGGSGGLGRGRGGSQTSGTKKSIVNPPGAPGKKLGSQPANTKNKIGTGSSAVAKQPNGQVKKKVWSKEDQMASKIQTCYRGYRCRKLLLLLRQKKQEYEDTIERLQREAFVQIVRMEQERAAKEREREEEARRKRREEAARVKRMLEAAFDGDNDEINKLLQEVAKVHSSAGDAIIKRLQYKLIDCTDPNNNTPISEAAAGGHSETIKMLVSLGANPNGKGQYGRTPLYRAAFGGHGEAVKMLLETGADPRIYADDGALPEHISVASGSDIELTLQEWNIEETEKKLVLLEDQMRKRREQEEKIWKTQEDRLQIEIKEAEKEHSVKQKELAKAYEELNKRIYEHDKSMNAKPELTLTAIHDAEEHLERCKLQADNAREKLQQAKLKMRMKRKEYQSDLDLEDLEEEVKADVVINIRELDDVLMKDVGDKIAQSNKWPLIIDPSKQCTTFLRYRDTNYLSVVNPKHMEPEIIRMNLLGAIRFGKFLVLDLLDIEDMWPVVVMKFEQVQQNLLPSLLNKDFLKEERYLKLICERDGELYLATQFLSARIGNFKLVILTQLPNPPVEIKEYTYIIRIHIPEPIGL